MKKNIFLTLVCTVILVACSWNGDAQEKDNLSIDQSIEIGLKNNKQGMA